MKNLRPLSILLLLGALASCQKQPTEEEKNAEIERQVQQRLATERQATEQQQLNQRAADLDAREKSITEKQNEAATAETPSEAVATATPTPVFQPYSMAQRLRDNAGNPAGATYSTFYARLDPYGDWIDTDTYGYVFQPRAAAESRAWRPYTTGHWVYTDAGWTWVSDEPFGWATYHYGRWTRLRDVGWVWVPGEQWAPAWVSWRKSDDYVGWAPLPPEARFDPRSGIHNWSDNYYDIGPDHYSFVPTREFGAERQERAVVSSDRNLTIVNQTTNVTNITYANTTVVNQGPNYDEMRGRTQRPIERLKLQRQNMLDLNEENPHAVAKGEVLEVPAPVIARVQITERPRSVKRTIAQPAVDLGWAGVTDHQAAERARAKIKSEATPPPNPPSKTFVRPVGGAGAANPAPAPPVSTPAQMLATAPPAQTAPSTPARQSAPLRSAQTPPPAATNAPSSTPNPAPPARRSLPPREFPTAPPVATVASTPMNTATPPIAHTPMHEVPKAPQSKPSPVAKPSATPTPIAPANQQKPGQPHQTPESGLQRVAPRRTLPMTSPPASPSRPATPTATATSSPTPDDKRAPKAGARPRPSISPAPTPVPQT